MAAGLVGVLRVVDPDAIARSVLQWEQLQENDTYLAPTHAQCLVAHHVLHERAFVQKLRWRRVRSIVAGCVVSRSMWRENIFGI